MLQLMAGKIAKSRKQVLAVFGVLVVISLLMMLKVQVNSDLTKYLPDRSRMKQGLDILTDEFTGFSLDMGQSIRVMIPSMSAADKLRINMELKKMEHVSAVSMTDGSNYSDPEDPTVYTLYTVSTPCAYGSKEEVRLEKDLAEAYADLGAVVVNDNTVGNNTQIPLWIICMAMAVLMLVLFALCESWVEPILFLAVIGVAILLNMGTNLIFGTISAITWSMAALMQLVLSMDYSIILMNRYRQERDMGKALALAFPSIAGSGFTTIVGLIMLVFMRFKIGMDLGLVLAKGVLLSMICVLTLLPAVILTFEKATWRTQKKSMHVPTDRVASFEYHHHKLAAIGFAVLFVAAFLLQRNSDYIYNLSINDPIAKVFLPANPVVVLYENEDEENAAELQNWLRGQEEVSAIMGTNMLGGLGSGLLRERIGGDAHTIMMVQLQLPVEGESTTVFLDRLEEQLQQRMSGEYYLIGNSIMTREMQKTFGNELMLITLLTAASIFLVVAFTFRNVLIPFVLVLIVQCGVFLTIMTTWLIGYTIYYLAILIVQCILMGATVDYGILFTNYYRELRQTMDRKEALVQAYRRSIHTILTSSLFMIFGTGSIGVSPADPTISQICLTISIGALCTTLLILFVLPGLLCMLDRWVCKGK